MGDEKDTAPTVNRKVTVGDEDYTIRNFKGFKAFRIGRVLSKLGKVGPEVSEKVNEFVREYGEKNAEKVPRATLELRYPEEAAHVSEEAWAQSGGIVVLPSAPTTPEILATVFPIAFEAAGEKVVDLLAWVIASDSELETKDGEGEEAIEKYIEGLRKKLLHRGDLDQLLELAAAAQDVLREQMAGKGVQIRSVLKLVGLGEDEEEEETPQTEEETSTEHQPIVASPVIVDEDEKSEPATETATPSTIASPSPSEKPDSSTDSPAPTDGDDETSSTDTTGSDSTST